MKNLLFIAAIATVSASAVNAGRSEADACAANLEADSKLIYDRVAPQVTPDREKNEAMLKATVKGMVEGGEIGFFGVRKKAEAAVACVALINS